MSRNDYLRSFGIRVQTNADGVFSALIALLIALFAWHVWSLAHLTDPLCMGGDCLQQLFSIKTVIAHGWFSSNPDVAAPFGAKMYDFPIPEPTTALVFHFLGLFTSNIFAVFNWYYLLGYAFAAYAGWWALRQLGIGRALSIAGAIAFSILPYHFLRLSHLQLSSYFPAAIFCGFALRLALQDVGDRIQPARLTIGSLVLLAIAAGGGVYYAFFGCIFIAAGAIYGALRRGDTATLRIGAAYVGVIIVVIAFSLLPNFFYHLANGSNPLVANRNPGDAEIYGLRITQMLLPTIGHRFEWARSLIESYSKHAPLVTENSTAALGIMGSIGFLIALAVFLFGVRRKLPVLSAAGALITTGVLYATIGGFGALAAFFLIPDIRGLNRISMFIAFFGLFALLTVISKALRKRPSSILAGVVAVAMVAVACADQIPTNRMPSAAITRGQIAAFEKAKTAYAQLQAALPPGAAVYELPYMFYPEEAPIGTCSSYDLEVPYLYLYTQGFRWSFGGMHGRVPDVWNQQVSQLTGPAFAEALAGSGFGAVYVDGNCYHDHGSAINRQLFALFGAPIWGFGDKAAYRVPAVLGAKPYAIAAFGQGWYSEESDGNDKSGMTWTWSQGDAVLNIANPGHQDAPLALRFQLAVATPRQVKIEYGDHVIGEYALRRGRYTYVTLEINAAPGISSLTLNTNTPPQRSAGGDSRKLGFRLINLAYGPR